MKINIPVMGRNFRNANENFSKPKSVEEVYHITTRSDLYKYVKLIKDLDKKGKFRINKPEDDIMWSNDQRMSLFESQSYIYFDTKRPNFSLYANQLTRDEWIKFFDDVVEFASNYFVDSAYQEVFQYFSNNVMIPKGEFYTSILFNEFQGYGINKGKWSQDFYELFVQGVNKYIDDISWNSLKGSNSLPYDFDTYYDYRKLGDDGWKLFLTDYPYMEMLDLTKSSGYPHWYTQNQKYVYNYSYNINEYLDDPKTHNIMTPYSRTQGGKFLDDGFKKKVKVRFVCGVPYHLKIAGAPISYCFRQSNPSYTPYFKDGDVVMQQHLEDARRCKLDPELDMYVTDISLCDQSHVKTNLEPAQKRMLYNATSALGGQSWLVKYLNHAYRGLYRPKMLWNVRQLQTMDPKIYSLSGSSGIPIMQTVSVANTHNVAVYQTVVDDHPHDDSFYDFINDREFIFRDTTQIDDVVLFSKKFDIDQMSKISTIQAGLEIGAEKTMKLSELGWIMSLKVMIGYFLNKEGENLKGLDGSKLDNGCIMGYPATKTAAMYDKERGARDDGQTQIVVPDYVLHDNDFKTLVNPNLIFIDPETGIKHYYVNKAVQQFFGSLTSFGNMAPLEFYQMLVHHFKDTAVFQKLLEILKIEDIKFKAHEWGFNRHEPLIKFLGEYA